MEIFNLIIFLNLKIDISILKFFIKLKKKLIWKLKFQLWIIFLDSQH